MNRMTRAMRGAAAITLALGTATAAAAQQPDMTGTPRNVISINPLGVVFSVYSGEYERAVGGNATVGLATTFWRHTEEYDEPAGPTDAAVNYFSADLKLRYYPTAALRGFSVGGLLGTSRIGGALQSCDSAAECEQMDGSAMALSAGAEVDYNWGLGSRQNFFIGMGLGAKRLFPINEDVDATLAYPFARFTIGWGF